MKTNSKSSSFSANHFLKEGSLMNVDSMLLKSINLQHSSSKNLQMAVHVELYSNEAIPAHIPHNLPGGEEDPEIIGCKRCDKSLTTITYLHQNKGNQTSTKSFILYLVHHH